MAKPIIPRIIRGCLLDQTADVLFPTFAQAATAWAAAAAHRLDIAEQRPSLRRCDDCQLNLGRDVLRALGTCPRWGMVRAGVESHCAAFVAKGASRG